MKMQMWGNGKIKIKKMKEVLSVIAVLCILWGIFGLIDGDGFLGGISKQFRALFELIKIAIGILIVIFILSQANKK